MGIVSVAMPLYAVSLHLSLVDITMLLAVSDAVALLLKPFMAGVADHWGFSRTLTLAIAPRSLLCLGYGFAAVPWHLYAVRSGTASPTSCETHRSTP